MPPTRVVTNGIPCSRHSATAYGELSTSDGMTASVPGSSSSRSASERSRRLSKRIEDTRSATSPPSASRMSSPVQRGVSRPRKTSSIPANRSGSSWRRLATKTRMPFPSRSCPKNARRPIGTAGVACGGPAPRATDCHRYGITRADSGTGQRWSCIQRSNHSLGLTTASVKSMQARSATSSPNRASVSGTLRADPVSARPGPWQ